MDMGCCADKDPAKTTETVDDRIEAMRAILLALPSQIVLHPDDLRHNLARLESLHDDPERLERTALSIVEPGYRR